MSDVISERRIQLTAPEIERSDVIGVPVALAIHSRWNYWCFFSSGTSLLTHNEGNWTDFDSFVVNETGASVAVWGDVTRT